MVDRSIETDSSGRAMCRIKAVDLNNMDRNDPVTGTVINSLPWDRQAGNFVYASIENPLRRTDPKVEEIEVAVRVLQKIDSNDIPSEPTFELNVKPLFAYYLRYFPWLHVRDVGDRFERFLDLSDAEELLDVVDSIIQRLQLDEQDPSKMPRSRDFPRGGVEILKRWRDIVQ